jgi:hypothetical protein
MGLQRRGVIGFATSYVFGPPGSNPGVVVVCGGLWVGWEPSMSNSPWGCLHAGLDHQTPLPYVSEWGL